MMFFQKKPLIFDTDTVGQQLRIAREQKGLKLEVVAKKLIIKLDYLKALEDNDIKKLPTGVYANNFLREYARFLGLDYKALVKVFNENNKNQSDNKEKVFERQVVKKKYLLAIPTLVRNFIIILVALVCLFYIGYLLNKIFEPPILEISYPASDTSSKEKLLTIAGQTEAESEVSINGQIVEVDNNGNFKKDIYLERGLNTIVVTARKKHSREAVVRRHILFE